MNFGEKLKIIRQSLGLNQQDQTTIDYYILVSVMHISSIRIEKYHHLCYAVLVASVYLLLFVSHIRSHPRRKAPKDLWLHPISKTRPRAHAPGLVFCFTL